MTKVCAKSLRTEWLERLDEAAPLADRSLLHVLARILAGEVGRDDLFTIADALYDAAAELALDELAPLAASTLSLALTISTEATRRPSSFW